LLTITGIASIFIGAAAFVLLVRRGLKSVDTAMSSETAKNFEASIVERSFDLQHPKEIWGKDIAASSGFVIFYDHYTGRLAGRLTLAGLLPNHTYVLTVNGRPGRPGNENLRMQYGVERYHDFMELETDAQGAVNNVPFQIDLPIGRYDLKFLVKDKDDWKVVLHNDFLLLTVE
jgi:hypothetical protein